MAQYYGNAGKSYDTGSSGDFGKNKLILKDEIKKDWYVYRNADHCQVKPYPILDANGNRCPVRSTDTTHDYSVLPDAFSILRIAAFAGVEKNLEFIDWCTDMDRYYSFEVEYRKTPYEWLVSGLKKMLPAKSSGKVADGFRTPLQLAQIQKSVGYSNESILFRGAMLMNKGVPMQTKNNVGGVVFKSVFYIPQKSAINTLISKFKEKREQRSEISDENCVMHDIFEIDGSILDFNKTVTQNAKPGMSNTSYIASLDFSPAYEATAAQFFGLQDRSQYYAALQALFGPCQTFDQILNNMTVQEMIAVLKDNYPISWLWYGLKDSPYADCITPEERNKALADPEMCERFGLEPAQTVSHNQAPSGYNQGAQREPQGYQQPATGYASYNGGASGYTQWAKPVSPTAQQLVKEAANNVAAQQVLDNASVNYTPKGEGLKKPTESYNPAPGFAPRSAGEDAIPYGTAPAKESAPKLNMSFGQTQQVDDPEQQRKWAEFTKHYGAPQQENN